jgi:putative chitinase
MSTLKMLEKLFDNDSTELAEVAGLVDEYGQKFGVNTPLRKAHFLAQVREEVGSRLRPRTENLNYSVGALKKVFGAFSRKPDWAEMCGRKDGQKADQKMIANVAYANRLGNGGVASGDGWKYRGRFFLQITGKANYEAVQVRIDRYLEDSGIDIVSGKYEDDVKTHLIASMAYWIYRDIYRKADLGKSDTAVNAVTKVINRYTDSYGRRREHFAAIREFV